MLIYPVAMNFIHEVKPYPKDINHVTGFYFWFVGWLVGFLGLFLFICKSIRVPRNTFERMWIHWAKTTLCDGPLGTV